MPLSSALLFTEDLLMTYLARACTQELILEGGLGSYDVPGAVSIIGPVNATIEFLTFQDIVTNLGSGLFVGAGAVVARRVHGRAVERAAREVRRVAAVGRVQHDVVAEVRARERDEVLEVLPVGRVRAHVAERAVLVLDLWWRRRRWWWWLVVVSGGWWWWRLNLVVW